MAKNREPLKHDESESSGEEGEEVSSDEVASEDSDSETEQPPVPKKAPSSTPATQQKKAPPHSAAGSSSDEEGEESGSETESESDGPDAQQSNIGARKPRSKPDDAEPVNPAKSTAAKRPVDDKGAEIKDVKKGKKKTEPETEKKSNDDSKKSLFQRRWSEDDEIVILKGMTEYASKKKSDPMNDLTAFHEFIKKSLHVDVTRTQLQDKIRRLRKKYENSKSKEKEGKERPFSKPHEQKAYELSKSIWGYDAGKESGSEKGIGSPKANGSVVRKAATKKAANANDTEEAKGSKSVVTVSDEGEKKFLGKRVSSGGGSVEERIMAAGPELFESGQGLEGEKQWKKLKMDEIEVHLKQMEVRTAQARLVLDALKSEDH